jgi:tryptophanyl-tRNA synthetase
MNSKRVLTGNRPARSLHLGHYFGTLQNQLKFQEQGFDTFIIISDYQMLTSNLETEFLAQNIREIVKDYIAIGLNPSKSTFFVQSALPQLAELTLLLSMVVSTDRVSRNATVKEEIKTHNRGGHISHGFFSYPISLAADVLASQANLVLVGEDQLPHLELTREIAKTFNTTFEEVLTIPEPILSTSPRLLGLDGTHKMSKSRSNAVFLSDDDSVVMKKVMKATTDSGGDIHYDLDEKPFISGLIDMFSLVSGKTSCEIEESYSNKNYKAFKQDLAEAIITFLKPIKERRSLINEKDIDIILKVGNEKARSLAAETLSKVKKAMKVDYEF